MKITEQLASLMKKKEDEPALKFEVAFHHERATIRTADGEVFDDWHSVADRWCIEHPAAYRICGPSFELLYLIAPDRLLLVQVSSAALTDTADGQRLWQGFSEPHAEFITARKGLDLLTNWGHKVPAIIKNLAKAEENVLLERDAQPARPIEIWANAPGLTGTTTSPRKRDDYFSLAWVIERHSTNLFKILNRWRREGVVYDRNALDCAHTFNRRFRPDTRRWLVEKKSPPPESLGIHELPWPTDLQDALTVILKLQSLIAIPLASAVAGFILPESHEAYPNAAERKRGFEMLDRECGEIARLTGTLTELLQQAGLKEHETEWLQASPAETVGPPIPSPAHTIESESAPKSEFTESEKVDSTFATVQPDADGSQIVPEFTGQWKHLYVFVWQQGFDRSHSQDDYKAVFDKYLSEFGKKTTGSGTRKRAAYKMPRDSDAKSIRQGYRRQLQIHLARQ